MNAEVQSRLVVEKAAGALRQENKSLVEKVKKAIQARDSAVAALRPQRGRPRTCTRNCM